MPVAQGYQHKKFDVHFEYEHKKFGHRCSIIKRKREVPSDIKSNEMNTKLMAYDTIPITKSEPPAKRRQTQAPFRPWLLDEETTQPSTLIKYQSNMARSHPVKDRNARAQQRREQNTLVCFKIRCAKKMETLSLEQEYIQLRLKEEPVAEATLRATLYLQELTALNNASQVMLSSHHQHLHQLQFLKQQRQQLQ